MMTKLHSEADAAAGVVPKKQMQQSKDDETKGLSRKERRKLLNAKHAAPQFPRVQNPAQRSKAYIRAAGLTPQKPSPPVKDQLLSAEEAAAQQEQRNNNLLGRRLGAPDERTRHRTVLQLRAYLQARSTSESGITELDLLKLWKCLWYTMYMADRVPVQQELSQHLCSLLWSVAGTVEEDEYAAATYLRMCGGEGEYDPMEDDDDDDDDEEEVTMEELENTLNSVGDDDDDDDDDEEEEDKEDGNESDSEKGDYEEKQIALLEAESEEEAEDDMNVGHCRGAHLASLFVRTFFRTVLREWSLMDKYRIDKFYSLLRDMLNVVYQYMAQRHWNLGIIRLFNDAMYEEVLSKTPNGVRYHLIDVCIEELCKVSKMDESPPLTEAVFLDVMEPFFAMAQTGDGDDTVHQRVVENVFEKFLTTFSVFRETRAKDDTKLVLDQVHVGTVAQFLLEVAADEACRTDTYRQNLYNLYKMYVRRMKQVGEDHDVDIEGDDDISDGDGDNNEVEHEKEESPSPDEEIKPPPILEPTATETKVRQGTKVTVAEPGSFRQVERHSKKKKKPKKATQEKNKTLDVTPVEEKDQSSVRVAKQKLSGESIDKPPVEEEITISFEDQKAAKIRLQNNQKAEVVEAKRTKKKKRNHRETEAEANERKRVKFDSTNKARSWKASMKALRTMDSPVTSVKPEQSILLNKGKGKLARVKKETARKKATDYF